MERIVMGPHRFSPVSEITLGDLHYFPKIPQKSVSCDLLPDRGKAHQQQGSCDLEIPSIIWSILI